MKRTLPRFVLCLFLPLASSSLVGGEASAQGVFLRGDCDPVAGHSIGDPLALLFYLFAGGAEPACLDACDANDDEILDLSDVLYLLGFLFLDGQAPSTPFPLEDADPGGTALSCANGRDPPDELLVTPSVVALYRLGASLVLSVRGRGGPLFPREQERLDANMFQDLRTALPTRYLSSSPQVCQVSEDGVLTARSLGNAVVEVRHRGLVRQVRVRVVGAGDGKPRVRITSPADAAVVAVPRVAVEGRVEGEAAAVRLGADFLTVTNGVFRGFQDLELGENRITVMAANDSGEQTVEVVVSRVTADGVDALGPDGSPLPVVPEVPVVERDTIAPRLEVVAPVSGTTLYSRRVVVEGTVDDPTAQVRVGGVPAATSEGRFTAQTEIVTALEEGLATIVVEAVDRVGNRDEQRIEVRMDRTLPRLTMDGPQGRTLVRGRDVRIEGTVEPAGAPVFVNDRAAHVTGERWRGTLALEPGVHEIVVRAELPGPVTRRVAQVASLVVDDRPPVLHLAYPRPAQLAGPTGYRVEGETLVFAGRLEDACGVPHVSGGSLRLRGAGVDRELPAGEFRLELPVAAGLNTLTLVVADARGNEVSHTYAVESGGPPAPTLSILAGDRQVARVGEAYTTVLAVRASSGVGSPVPEVPIHFAVVQGDAVLPSGGQTETVLTATSGSASISLVAGRHAGAESVVVAASAEGYANSPVAFVLGVEPGRAATLVPHRRRRVSGEATQWLPRPLAVRLLDAYGNPLPDELVVFRVTAGSALFPEGQTQSMVTDALGIAQLPLRLAAGDSTSTVQARHPGVETLEFFVAGYEAGPVADTRLRVEVLDERGRAVVGARVHLPWFDNSVEGVTDRFGEVVLAPAAHGEVLIAASAPLPGTPGLAAGRLADVMVPVELIAGRDNALPQPLVLPSLEGVRARTQFLPPGTGCTFTFSAVSGLRLDVAPGSVRFPGGAESGELSLLVPHRGSLPAPLPDDGVVDVPVWLFPAGVRFDPPAVLTVPRLRPSSGDTGIVPGGSGRPARLFAYHAGEGTFVETAAGAKSVSTSLEAAGGLVGGGLYFLGDLGPPGGRTVTVRGRLEGALPGVGEVPQREDSTTLGHHVYAHSGEFYVDEVDLELRGRGLAYRFRRRYESRHVFHGILGHNWEHEYEDRRLFPGAVDGNIVRASGTGRFDEYLADGSGRLVSPPGVFSILFADHDDFWVERTPDGVRYTYQPFDGTPLAGKLLSVADSHRNRLVMTRRGNGRLDFVTDPLGRRIEYVYDADERLSQIRGPAGRTVGFVYDEMGNLVEVVRPAVIGTPNGNDFPDGTRQAYVYFGASEDPRLAHNLTQIIDPREAVSERRPRVTVSYDENPASAGFDRVVSQLVGGTNSTDVPSGGLFLFEYELWGRRSRPTADAAALEAYLVGSVGRTSLVDPSGRRRVVTYNGAGLCVTDRVETLDDGRPRALATLHPPPGTLPPYYETRRAWSREGLLLEEVAPRGNRMLYTYDEGAPLRLSQAALLRVEKHPSDGVGEALVTEYRRDPLFGRVIREAPPRSHGLEETDAARFLRLATLDYQEAATAEALARATGVEMDALVDALARAGVELGLGDRNEDGVVGGVAGDVIVETKSRTSLASSGIDEETRLLTTRRVYNAYGQEVQRTDGDGRIERWEYHPESDPEGDGELTVAQGLDSATGGFLAAHRSGNPNATDEAVTRFLYDAFGYVAERTDPLGNRQFETHNARGQLVEWRVAPPLNYRRQFFYDADGNLVEERTQNYTSVPGGGSFLVSANPWIETFLEYDLLGQRVAQTQEVSGGEIGPEKSRTTRYRYHPTGELAGIIYPGENGGEATEEAFFYDARGFQIRREIGAGSDVAAAFRTWYDENGNVVLEIDAADSDGDGEPETTERRYDGHDRLVASIDPAGGVRVFERDADGRVVGEAFVGSGGGSSAAAAARVLLERRSYRYDETGALTEERREGFGTDDGPRTLVRRLGRDAQGRVRREVFPDGSERVLDYDAGGRLVRERGPHGSDRLLERDAIGNVVREVRTTVTSEVIDASAVGDPDYDPAGRLREEVRVLRRFDPLGRLSVLVDPAGGTWRVRYNSRDQRVFISDATGTRINPQTDPELEPLLELMTPQQLANLNDHGNRRLYDYDGLGHLVAAHHELRRGGRGGGQIEFTEPFVADGVIDETYEWDGRGRLRAWTDDAGRRTALEYDAAGYVTRKVWPDSSEELYARDRDGCLTKMTDPNGSVILQQLDALGRVVERTVDPADGVEGTQLQRFEYDGLSRVTLAFDGNDPVTTDDDMYLERRYDSLGNTREEIQGLFSVRRRHDTDGRLVTLRYPGGQVLEYDRDAAGHLTSLRDGSGVLATYRRFGSGRVLEKRLWNGPMLSALREDQDGLLRNRGYDVSGGVREQVYRTPAGDVLFGSEYGREQSGLAGYEIPAGGDGSGTVWRYDSVYRLREYLPGVFDPRVPPVDPLKRTLFFPDGNHTWGVVDENLVERTFQANSRSQYTNVDGETLDYDAAGNLTRQGNRRFVYDALKRLIRVSDGGADVATYAYDAAGGETLDDFRGTGRLVSKDVAVPAPGQAAGRLDLLYFDHHVIEERAPSGDLARQYVYEDGGRVAMLLAYADEASPSLVTFLHDDRGAVVATYDEGAVLQERLQYDARGSFRLVNRFGGVQRSSRFGNGVYVPGTYYQFELGLYLHGARPFDPALGRFLTETATLAPQRPLGLNPYLGDGFPGVRGEVTGVGSSARRASELEPFRVELFRRAEP